MGNILKALGLDSFDTEKEANDSFDPIPAGDYNVIIDNCELKDTKKGDGQYLNFKFIVKDGQYEGRFLFSAITIANPNADAVKIGAQQLANISKATGVEVNDTDDFIDASLCVSVIIKDDHNGNPRNEVKRFKSIQKQDKSSRTNEDKEAAAPVWRRGR